jgi:gas vesicle protein
MAVVTKSGSLLYNEHVLDFLHRGGSLSSMTKPNRSTQSPDRMGDIGAFLIGGIIGGLGALLAALWFAPRSGVQTRRDIQERALEMRVQAEQAASEARAKIEGVNPTDVIAQAKADAQRYQAEQTLEAR